MKFLFLLFLFFSFSASAQEYTAVEVKFGLEKKKVKAVERKDALYISVKDFAAQFKVSFYFSEVNKKGELKFKESTIKFTAKNPFVVISNAGSKIPLAYQMPLSTLFYAEDIFVESKSFRQYIGKAQIKMLTYLGQTNPDTPSATPDNSTLDAEVKLNYAVKSNGAILKFALNNNFGSFRHSMKNKTITVQLDKTTPLAASVTRSFNDGIVDSITVTPISGGIIIHIQTGTNFDAYDIIKNNSKSLTFSFRKKDTSPTTIDLSGRKDKWKFDVVVIDAGHGGKDMGAIGVNRTIEKDINLSVALKLGKLIQKNLPEVKVVYTRKSDNFVELHKRGKIANDAGGKLFISIHCNSVAGKKKAPNGTEVYLLRPGRTQDAIEIAEIENSVISYEEDPKKYKTLTDENFILVSMAHASYMKYSEKFAELLDINFQNKLEINSRGIKQAGFYVLVGASMPGVLIETGYVTNDRDAAYIRSEKGQNDLAGAILDAVKTFRNYYEKAMKEN